MALSIKKSYELLCAVTLVRKVSCSLPVGLLQGPERPEFYCVCKMLISRNDAFCKYESYQC